MNKAFTREPDSPDSRCPRCGAIGQDVATDTIAAHALPEAIARLAPSACYCPTPVCEVVYFDAFERGILVSELRCPVYPKDPDAPICPCFGATIDEIEQDLAEGTVLRVRKMVEQAKSPAANCHLLAVHGRSCATEVQRYFMQRRNAH
ncbi:MAG TPA: hypothetical protein VL096_16175 [Pirellulaceae bacterium]|nr:hypothetical protein [Pirellulaceae bacterium]